MKEQIENWEETVMDETRMLGCSLRGKYAFEVVKDIIKDTAIAQAQITWDIAYKAGQESIKVDLS